MGRFFCDWCEMYLSHDSPASRKQHRFGWRHRENFRKHYEKIISQRREEEQRKFFLEKGLPIPPMLGVPPPIIAFNFPPPMIPIAGAPPLAMPASLQDTKRARLEDDTQPPVI